MYNANRGYYMAIIRYSLLCLLCMAGFNANADTQTPTTRITSNLNNLVAGSVTLSGNATDQGGSGVDRVFVSIRNNAGMFFYDGAFRSEDTVTFRHLNVANGTDQWSISLPLLPAGSYEVTARARDGARNQNPQVRDRRTVVVQPRNTTSSGGANSLVQGNTIRFPNNDYYQVQSADGTRNICEGERECDVADGTYLVINHTTGERIRGVVVGNGSGSNTSSGGSNTGSSSNSSSGMGGFTVSGNTIRFSNDDYYQVQTAGGTRTICEGERTCDVEDGTYIIINHTSGERYTDVVVNNGINAGKPEFEDITVSGNTILLSNSNFYYQVQSAGGTRTICEGEQSCEVPDGTYLVINHTTGERFGNIVVGNDELLASSFDPIVADSVITVTGNTISYPDNGYYQAQTADGSRSICEGERSCTVPDGEYVVINHTTGERSSGIFVPGAQGDSQDNSTITTDNYRRIYENMVARLYTGFYRPFFDSMQFSSDATLVSETVFGPFTDQVFTCNGGGGYETNDVRGGAQGTFTIEINDCLANDVLFNGRFSDVATFGSPFSSSSVWTDYSSVRSDSDRIDMLRYSSGRGGNQISSSFSFSISGYQLLNGNIIERVERALSSVIRDREPIFSGESTNPEFRGRFTLDVLDGVLDSQVIRLEASEGFAGLTLLANRAIPVYTTGQLEIVAEDGNRILIDADNGDPETFTASVTTAGFAETFTVPWNENNIPPCFQVNTEDYRACAMDRQ